MFPFPTPYTVFTSDRQVLSNLTMKMISKKEYRRFNSSVLPPSSMLEEA